MPYIIPHTNFEQMLILLRGCGLLYAPVTDSDGIIRFALLKPGMLPDLNAVRTLLPPKKYLLHPQEALLT